MIRVFLSGYRRLDFPAKDDPNRQIKGYSMFICTPKDDGFGVFPVDDGGKRFVSDAAALNMGLSKKFLDENLYDFINVDIDVNGKIAGIAALTDEERSAPDYPFAARG